MLPTPIFKARTPAASAAPRTNLLCNLKCLHKLCAAQIPLCAVKSSARTGRLPHARTAAAASVSATDGMNLMNDANEEDNGYDDDSDEFLPPPLPTSALELLSQLLTGIAAKNAADPTDNSNPLRFCVNCCRPLPVPGAVCTGCGHDPRRNVEVLGDPTAWVEAYAAQLLRQQQQDQQLQEEAGAAAVVANPAPPASFGRSSASNVLLAADARTMLHRSSLPPYPGRPERLQAIMSRLHSAGLMEHCQLLACRPATDPELLSVHSPELVEAVRGLMGGGGGRCCGGCSSSSGGGSASGSSSGAVAVAAGSATSSSGASQAHSSPLCADTLFNAHTSTAALLAAGAAADLGMALASGRARSGLAVMRPPGAQAGVDRARGGCYLNNAAVAAAAALSAGQGVQRVMIVDWDVHHGRGTQEIFANDPRVMVVSMHRYDSETYPGSGAVEEVGEGQGEGTTLNIAFGGSPGGPGGGGLVDGDLLSAALHVVLPVAHQFRPQVVLVAAGFGALKGDPIGGCSCSPALFAHLTHLLSSVAPRGLGLMLEGGYNLSATGAAVEGCLRVLLGEAPPPLPGPWGTTSEGWVAIMNAMQIHSQYWSSLHPLSFNGWTSAIANQQRQLQQQQEQEERRRLELLQQRQLEQEQEEFFLRMQQQHHQQQHHGQQSGALGSAAAGAAAALGGWAPSGLRDDDVDGGALDDDGGNDPGVSVEDLARVAEALVRARESGVLGIDGVGGGAQEAQQKPTWYHGMAAAELDDPRDIDPMEMLDVILGTGGSSEDGGRKDGSGHGAEGAAAGELVAAGDASVGLSRGSPDSVEGMLPGSEGVGDEVGSLRDR